MKKYMKYPCAFHLTKKTVIKDFFPSIIVKRQNTLVLINQNFLSIFVTLKV